MLKNVIRLEVKIAEKMYHLFCDNDAPIDHLKEALFQITKTVADIEENIASAKKKQEEQVKPAEVPVQEEETK